jgi:hypothetical protein
MIDRPERVAGSRRRCSRCDSACSRRDVDVDTRQVRGADPRRPRIRGLLRHQLAGCERMFVVGGAELVLTLAFVTGVQKRSGLVFVLHGISLSPTGSLSTRSTTFSSSRPGRCSLPASALCSLRDIDTRWSLSPRSTPVAQPT